MAGLVKGLLENDGIDCLMKNQILSSGIGELPLNDCWPEVWIIDNDDYDKAADLVNDFLTTDGQRGTSWKCRCGEMIEGQFDACWKCGRERPAE